MHINSDGYKNDEESNKQEDDDDVDLDDFEEYVAQSRVPKKKLNKQDISKEITDDYIESDMADVDAQEKKSRRRTLRFYTSKIDQQENKKIDKFKGDDDIPYKERFFERQQRLLEEARKRGLNDPNAIPLDDNEYNSADENTSKSVNSQSENDYYKQIQLGRQGRKTSRTNAHRNACLLYTSRCV